MRDDRQGVRGRSSRRASRARRSAKASARSIPPVRAAKIVDRPAAAMPTARACSTRVREACPGGSPVGSAARPAPARSRPREPRTPASSRGAACPLRARIRHALTDAQATSAAPRDLLAPAPPAHDSLTAPHHLRPDLPRGDRDGGGPASWAERSWVVGRRARRARHPAGPRVLFLALLSVFPNTPSTCTSPGRPARIRATRPTPSPRPARTAADRARLGHRRVDRPLPRARRQLGSTAGSASR